MEAEGHTFPDGIVSAIITGMSELWLSDPGVLTLMILGLQIVSLLILFTQFLLYFVFQVTVMVLKCVPWCCDAVSLLNIMGHIQLCVHSAMCSFMQ